ncbi:MAG: M48 family metallopeptidase [Aestuariivirgaceae bacterium]
MATRYPAQYFDGQTAASRDVAVELLVDATIISDDGQHIARWGYGGMEAANPVRAGQPLRLKHQISPTSRLIVPSGSAASLILERAPHLHGGFNPASALKFAAITAAGLFLFATLGYALLNLAPQKVAALMPAEWRERLADQAERTFIKDAKQCTNAAGTRALSDIAGRVAAASPDAPDFSVRVFDMPFINAFALPGGRVVLTGRLIKAADSPEEVAGVIAHELGHTAYLHPEASLIRAIGIQLLLNVATGGSSGDTLGGLAGLLTILQYSRNAEREADDYAVNLMTKGAIDPKGLRHFFEKLSKKEWKILTGNLETLSDMLSTHPGTKERIEFIKPLPPGTARPVVPDETWKQLKKICS